MGAGFVNTCLQNPKLSFEGQMVHQPGAARRDAIRYNLILQIDTPFVEQPHVHTSLHLVATPKQLWDLGCSEAIGLRASKQGSTSI